MQDPQRRRRPYAAVLAYVRIRRSDLRRAGGDVIGLCWPCFTVGAAVFTMCLLPMNRTVVLQLFPQRIVAAGSPAMSISAKSRRICVT